MGVLIVNKSDMSIDCTVRGYKSQFLRGSECPSDWGIRGFEFGVVNGYGLKVEDKEMRRRCAEVELRGNNSHIGPDASIRALQ